MSTSNINLTIESPDMTLTGDGTFNITNYLSELFFKDMSLAQHLKEKVNEIFDGINAKTVSTDWTSKLKKAFTIDSDPVDLNKLIKEQLDKTFTNLNIDTSLFTPTKANATNTESVTTKAVEALPEMVTNKITPEVTETASVAPSPVSALPEMVTNKIAPEATKPSEVPKNISVTLHDFDPIFSTKLIKLLSDNKLFGGLMGGLFGKKIGNEENKEEKPASETAAKIQPPTADSIFKQTLDVNIVDISSDLIAKLFLLLGIKAKGKDTEGDKAGGEVDKGMFGGMMGGMFGKTLPGMLSKLAGPALLAGGMMWMAIDGMRGYFASDEWNVGKIAGTLGGALGGMGEGLSGALANAGKGAAIGSGIGMMVGGPVGLVIGALIGAGVGAILGYIGGKNLAQGFQAFGDWWDKNITIGLFGGMDNIKAKFEAVGTWINTNVVPALENFGKDALEWIETTLLPAIKNLLSALKPLMKGMAWLFTEVIWPLAKWLGGALWEYAKRVVGDLIEGVTFLINFFVAFGEQLGIVINDVWQGMLWFKDKFVAFGEWIGTSLSNIIDWVKTIPDNIMSMITSAWDNTVTFLKKGFDSLFGFIGNLGTMIKDFVMSLVPDFLKSPKKAESVSPEELAALKAKRLAETQASATPVAKEDGTNVQIQPDGQDKMVTVKAQGGIDGSKMVAKPDDVIGKLFINIDKQLTLLAKSSNRLSELATDQLAINKKHTELFESLIDVNKSQLTVLPSLKPIPPNPAPPNMNAGSPIGDFRKKTIGRLGLA